MPAESGRGARCEDEVLDEAALADPSGADQATRCASRRASHRLERLVEGRKLLGAADERRAGVADEAPGCTVRCHVFWCTSSPRRRVQIGEARRPVRLESPPKCGVARPSASAPDSGYAGRVSEAESAGSPEPSYDPAELRARMAVCLTANELRELGEGLGAPGLSVERGATEAARLLVRYFEKSGGLGPLVARLHELKPLVEWPEPIVAIEAPSPFAPPPAPVLLEPGAPRLLAEAAPASEGSEAPASAPKSSSAAFVAPVEELDGPIIQDPHAPPVAAPEPWVSGNDGVVRPRGRVSEPPAPAARGIDPKILLAVAGMTLLAAVFAFAAGRATSHPAPAASAEASPTAAPSAGIPARRGGPAALAANALARSLVDVARICEVALSGAPTPELLHAAFAQCGPAPIQRQPTIAIPPASVPAEPTAAADDQPRRQPSPSRADRIPSGPDDGCLKSCQSEQSSCNTKCGPEPTDASKYGDYQACYSRCLTGSSKCRLKCPSP